MASGDLIYEVTEDAVEVFEQYDTVTFYYASDRWVESATSNN